MEEFFHLIGCQPAGGGCYRQRDQRSWGHGPRAGQLAAAERGIPAATIDPRGRIVEFGDGSFRRRLRGPITSLTPAISIEIARDKHLTNRYLRRAGLPVPENIAVLVLQMCWLPLGPSGIRSRSSRSTRPTRLHALDDFSVPTTIFAHASSSWPTPPGLQKRISSSSDSFLATTIGCWSSTIQSRRLRSGCIPR